jgi:hypothetical protein
MANFWFAVIRPEPNDATGRLEAQTMICRKGLLHDADRLRDIDPCSQIAGLISSRSSANSAPP